MTDAVVAIEFARQSLEEPVARVARGHDQMRGQRGFGRAHRPDMQVVHRVDPWQAGQIGAHLVLRNPLGHAKHAHGDAVLQQAPGAPRNDEHDDEANRRIDPALPGPNDCEPCNNDAQADEGQQREEPAGRAAGGVAAAVVAGGAVAGDAAAGAGVAVL